MPMQISVMDISAADQTIRPTLSSVVRWGWLVAVRGVADGTRGLTEVVGGVEAFDFGGAFDAGGGGAARVVSYGWSVKRLSQVRLHQAETHTTGDRVLFALRHVERPHNDPGEDGKEEVDQDGGNCSSPVNTLQYG